MPIEFVAYGMLGLALGSAFYLGVLLCLMEATGEHGEEV